MSSASPVVITAAVEGPVDEAVASVLVTSVGASLGAVHGRRGKQALHKRVEAYNRAARRSPWLVLVDLDRNANCAPPLRMSWLPHPAPLMALRIAVRAVESWFLADAEAIAAFLGVSQAKIPRDPEALDDPKRSLVELALSSRRRDIREDLVPRSGSGRRVGPAYTARAIEFAGTHWKPGRAAPRSSSLGSCIKALQRIVS